MSGFMHSSLFSQRKSSHSRPLALTEISSLRESIQPPSPEKSPSAQMPKYPLAPLISGTSSHLRCTNFILCSNLLTSPFHAITTCLFSLVFDIGYTVLSPISTLSSACVASKSSFLTSSLIISPMRFLVNSTVFQGGVKKSWIPNLYGTLDP